jgi:hypothetical protein
LRQVLELLVRGAEFLQTALGFPVEPGVLDQDTKFTSNGCEKLHALEREVLLFTRG